LHTIYPGVSLAISVLLILGVEMKEQSLGLPVYLLGYPIALAIMITFYASEVLEAGLSAARQALAIPPAGTRR
jgi:hypothetical protein